MATSSEWARGFARQADEDLKTLETLESLSVPECHKLQFLQMACEKLVKAHLLVEGTDAAALQTSHGYVAKNLPLVLQQEAASANFRGGKAKEVLNHARRLAHEIEVLAPAVKRGGQRRTTASIRGKTMLGDCMFPWTGRFNRLDSSSCRLDERS